jgi:hypothetical protein
VVTLKAIFVGRLALIMPVTTSFLGVCVAMTKWIPAARPFWAMRQIEVSTSLLASVIMMSASSSMIMTR